MGRGRAKAKQTKVARQLKYNSGGMDLERLRDELVHDDGRVDGESAAASQAANSTDVDDDDPYAAYADEDDDPYAQYAEDEDDDVRR
jgi:Protein of unknown function (DUF3073)